MRIQGDSNRSFSNPSPGEILKRSPPRRPMQPPAVHAPSQPIDISGDPFQDDHLTVAWKERGILLAPLLVTWHYKVMAARPFAKWLRTKEMLLADGRLGIQDVTRGVHYFGTYVVGDVTGNPDGVNRNSGDDQPASLPVDCQTLWGFSDQASMDHMFELCRSNVERMTIVETDLRDFVIGLKTYINDAGPENFAQHVMITPSAL